MTGHGRAHGAVTILNATATGIGCALAIDHGIEATWTPSSKAGIALDAAGVDDRLAYAVLDITKDHLDAPAGADVSTQGPFPPSRGLKTSSSAAAAMLRAAWDAHGKTLDDHECTSLAVAACRAAGVTLTGALDDQVATVMGGCHLTDNPHAAIVTSFNHPNWAVAVWVPQDRIGKKQLADLPTASIRDAIEAATDLAHAGELGAAMTANGRAYTKLYARHGLPVTQEPADVALEQGAIGAGLSGTGPAVAALFEARVELPVVSRGTWRWTKVVPK